MLVWSFSFEAAVLLKQGALENYLFQIFGIDSTKYQLYKFIECFCFS